MKKFFFIMALLMFFVALGIIGGMENDCIHLADGVGIIILCGVLAYLFLNLGDAFDPDYMEDEDE